MKLAEFLNDDTCQIFLAIIVGIVVCYFIFGSCDTCRDGFSVGGPCEQVGSLAQSRVRCDSLNNDRQGCQDNQACRWVSPGEMVVNTPRQQCGQFIIDMDATMESTCQHENEDEAGIREDCCFGEIPGQDGGIMLMNNANPNYVACSDPSNTDLKTELDEFQTVCQREHAGGDTRVASRTETANSPPPPPPPPLTRNQNIKNDMKQILLQIIKEGEQFYDTLTGPREPTFGDYLSIAGSKGIYFMILINNKTESSFNNEIFMDTKPNGSGGFQNIVTLSFDGLSEYDGITTEDLVCNAKNQLYELPLIDSRGNQITSGVDDSGKLSITMYNAPERDLQDIRQQVNNICNGGGYRKVRNDQTNSIDDIYIPESDCQISCQDGTIPWSPICAPKCSKDINKKFKLGDYFRTSSVLEDEQLQKIYCEPNAMTIGTEEKYDPLLKVKTKELIDNNFCSGIWKNTDGNDCTGPDCDYEYVDNLTSDNDISDELRSRELSTNAGQRGNTPLSEDYKNVKSNIPNKNKYEMIVRSHYTMLERAMFNNNPKYIDIKVDKDINTEINDGNTTTFTLSRNKYYRLLKAYGLSQEYSGNIYNSPVEGDIDAATMNLPSQNSYLYNLHRLQYLIAKILLGTGRYYDDNINIYRNIPAHPNPGPLASRTLNTTNYTTPDGDDLSNTQCGDSESDYLLLVFKDYGNSVSNLSEDNIPDCSTDSVSFNDAYNTGILSGGNICRLPPPPPPPSTGRTDSCSTDNDCPPGTSCNNGQCA